MPFGYGKWPRFWEHRKAQPLTLDAPAAVVASSAVRHALPASSSPPCQMKRLPRMEPETTEKRHASELYAPFCRRSNRLVLSSDQPPPESTIMAKFSDIRRDVMKRLKVDGRTREGRKLKAAAQNAKAEINGEIKTFLLRPFHREPGRVLYFKEDGTEVTAEDCLRADFNAFYVIK